MENEATVSNGKIDSRLRHWPEHYYSEMKKEGEVSKGSVNIGKFRTIVNLSTLKC